MPALLNEIISSVAGSDPDIRIVSGEPPLRDLGIYTRRKRIDAIIFSYGSGAFKGGTVQSLLHANPRLCLLGLNGAQNRGILHRLVPSQQVIDDLTPHMLISAIRSGTELRLG